MPNVMAALPNIGGGLCSTPQSLADAHYFFVFLMLLLMLYLCMLYISLFMFFFLYLMVNKVDYY